MSEIKQQLQISQQQHLTAHQHQSLKLLELPLLKLQQRIDMAMALNPVIEYEYRSEGTSLNEFMNDDRSEYGSDDDYSNYDNDSWHDDLPIPDASEAYSEERRMKREYMLSSLRAEKSMQEQLLEDIADADFNSEEQQIAETVVMAINERGYLDVPLADIAQSCNAELVETEDVLKKLQKLFVPGVGARDFRECLRLQLEAKGEYDRTAELLFENLDELKNGRYEALSRKLDIPQEDIRIFKDKLQNLNPYPGYILSSDKAQIIIPELEIVFSENEYVLKSNDEFLPRIKISQQYQNMLDADNIDEETRKYLKEKISEAEQLSIALDMREKTIVRIGRLIMENQTDYLDDGPEYLRPMTMAEAAQILQIHESTVSRSCAEKYIATPFGVRPFKYFFSGGFSSRDGAAVSAHAIEERIKIYIADEDRMHPLSDEKIANMLYAEGFDIARRTVAKYRGKLKIPSASERKIR